MEDREKAKDAQCPKRLNFNLPLLSTKRHYGQTQEEEKEEKSSSSASWYGKQLQVPRDDERIPFSWEQAPGKPKHVDRIEDVVQQVVETPRPRPPPCRWQHHYCGCGVESVVHVEPQQQQVPPKQADEEEEEEEIVFSSEDYAILDHTISCCDNNENDDQGEHNNFTDAMEDVFSLSEAMDILERTRKVDDDDDEDDGDHDDEEVVVNCNELRNRVLECRGITSPSFIINRFLPDANAIAAASSSALSHLATNQSGNNNHHKRSSSNKQQRGIIKSNRSCCSSSKSKVCDIRSMTRSQDSPKGCGMENLLPWRMKHKLCGIKSPVVITSQHHQQRPNSPASHHLHFSNRPHHSSAPNKY